MYQTTELINTAVLTGEKQMYPLSIFSVSHAGRILDVTSQTACHSGDEDVLQVDTRIFSWFLCH